MSSDTSDSEDSSSASSESSDFDGEGGEELTQQDYDEEYEDEYARKEKEGMRQIEEATASMRLLGNEEAMRYPFCYEFNKVSHIVEIVESIFAQLPVQDLTNGRKVCKMWRNLIDHSPTLQRALSEERSRQMNAS